MIALPETTGRPTVTPEQVIHLLHERPRASTGPYVLALYRDAVTEVLPERLAEGAAAFSTYEQVLDVWRRNGRNYRTTAERLAVSLGEVLA